MRPARMCTIAARDRRYARDADVRAGPWRPESKRPSSTAGSRMFPSTRPTTPPASATAKHQAQKR